MKGVTGAAFSGLQYKHCLITRRNKRVAEILKEWRTVFAVFPHINIVNDNALLSI